MCKVYGTLVFILLLVIISSTAWAGNPCDGVDLTRGLTVSALPSYEGCSGPQLEQVKTAIENELEKLIHVEKSSQEAVVTFLRKRVQGHAVSNDEAHNTIQAGLTLGLQGRYKASLSQVNRLLDKKAISGK